MPSGLIASVGSGVDDRVYDPNTGKWLWTGKTMQRHYGTSVLLPLQNAGTEKGKILVCAGSPGSPEPSTNTVRSQSPVVPMDLQGEVSNPCNMLGNM